MAYWLQVRKELEVEPVVAGMVDGDCPVFVERYLYRSTEKTVSGLRTMVLVLQFGGSRVQEGEDGHWRGDFLPSRAMLLPANCATHWHYSGSVDFAVFYFPEKLDGIQESLATILAARGAPMQFGDTLVGTSALQLVKELHKGASADKAFLALLVEVMLKQTYRILTTPDTGGINPRHIHFSRLQAVLAFIHDHLADDLSIAVLAALAGVSQTHFRRLFQDTMGVPPHRYILALRLEQARNLLAMTSMPIARIATSCGFSDQSHLTASFRTVHAATPAEYRAHATRSS